MSKVIVMSDAHIVKENKTNSYWCRTAVHGYDFWKRYLDVFDSVTVVARVKKLETVDKMVYSRADGEGVKFVELPFVRGAKGYIANFLKLKKIMKTIISDEDCGVFRLPSLPTFMLLDEFKKLKRPYSIEVIVDPEDAYQHNFFAQKLLTRKLKKECLLANGVSYVTKEFLQRKYPSRSIKFGKTSEYFDEYYSSINLESNFFYEPRDYSGIEGRPIRIIHVASAINSDVKGHTTLLKVMKKLDEYGIDFTLRCIGDGDRRDYFEKMVDDLGIASKVRFLGLFSDKNELREELLKSDLMVFPTQAEGLPRVLIEAMAVGLPCLSTPVNGIPELLSSDNMFDPYDVEGFTDRIIYLKKNFEELNKMSKINYEVAHRYENSVLQKRRNEFYGSLKHLAELKG